MDDRGKIVASLRRATGAARLFARLIDLTHDAVMLLKFDGTIIFWNRTAAELYGWTAEEAVGKNAHKLLQTRFPASDAEVKKALTDNGQWEGELLHTAKGGRKVLVKSRWSVTQEEEGDLAILEVTLEIGHERQMEAQLRESEERFRAVFTNAASGIVVVALDGKFLTVNTRFCEITGYSWDQLRSKRFQDITHPGDVKRDHEVYQRLQAGEVPYYSVEKRYVRPDGSIAWVRLYSSVVRDSGGHAQYAVTIVNDVTEQKRALLALQRSEEEFRLLADAVPQLVWTAAPDGGITFVNRRWLEYTGMDAGEAVGSAWQRIIHPEDLRSTVAAWEHSLQSGEPYYTHERLRRGDGAYVWHLTRALPARDERGRITAWFGTSTDVSELRRAEELVRELSTPVLPVRERLLIVPLIGRVDEHRARQVTEQLLRAIRDHRARVVVIDLTGVATVDARVANHLIQTAQAGRLLGAEFFVSGISRQVAQAFSDLGLELSYLRTVGDLQSGIEEAERLLEDQAA